MASERIYVVQDLKNVGKPRLIKAKSKRSALYFCVADQFDIHIPTVNEIVQILPKAQIEDATAVDAKTEDE